MVGAPDEMECTWATFMQLACLLFMIRNQMEIKT